MSIIELFQQLPENENTILIFLEKLLKGVRVPELRKYAKQIDKKSKVSDEVLFNVIKEAINSREFEVKFFSVLLLGHIAPNRQKYLDFLRYEYCKDEDWRVKEATAMAFDTYCSIVGYEKCLDLMKNWMNDSNENVRRAVSEGLRVWTSRPYFKENPQIAIDILGILKEDTSLYVKKSVANSLSDISKKYPELILKNFETWINNNSNTYWIIEHACRHLVKSEPYRVKNILINNKI